MILVDTNVFVDVWTSDPHWGAWSSEHLAQAADHDVIAINPIVYAELAVGFETAAQLELTLDSADIQRLPLPYETGWDAARAFAAYRNRGGSRRSPLPDFYIGAHALVAGCQLLTRDASRYRTYFPSVRLIAPPQASR